jgi:hypothetical protein
MPPDNGSSLLTEAPSAAGGNPSPDTPRNAAQEALATAQEQNDIPDYVPEKFWDREKRAPKIEDLGRSYKNLEKLLGTEKVPRPTSDDDEEGWERWYAASGRPDSEDKYEFKRPELPSDLPYDEEAEKNFRTWAKANGLNKRQASNLYDAYAKTQMERHAAYHTGQKQARSNIEQNLRREYGQQFDAKVNVARQFLREYGDPDFMKWLDETGQGNDPRMIRLMIRAGEKMNGETKLKGAPAADRNEGDLKAAIANFREKHKESLWKKDHPDHDLRVREYNKLFQALYPDQ